VPLTHLIFDLDNTLYPPTRGVVERVDVLITGFIVERFGMTLEAANALRARYREAHGTTLAGLMLHHDVSPDEYLEHVHAIEVHELLEPDCALLSMLDGLPHRKIVFTNGSGLHAERVLACLGIRPCFHDVFSLERVSYVPKPSRAAFQSVLAAIGAPPATCVTIDDRPDNLCTAHALGMATVLVGASLPGRAEIDVAIPSILDLPDALPALAGS
jgi:putative hydrolase of the HAD superfamily